MADTITIVYLAVSEGFAVLLMAQAWPRMRRTARPTPFFGFRRLKSERDRAIWVEVNAVVGRLSVGLGLGLAVVPPLLFLAGVSGRTIMDVCPNLFVVGMLVAVARGEACRRRLESAVPPIADTPDRASI